MKSKYFILLTMCSLFCLTGCFLNGKQPQDSGSSSTGSENQEEIVVPTTPIISVNQASVILGVGESYTLVATATNVENASFIWSIDGDAADDVVSVTQNGNTATIKALKVGETKLIASIEHDGHLYFKSVDVTVKATDDVVLILSENVGFDDGGYHVDLSTMKTDNGDITSIMPIVTAYKNNRIVAIDSFTWNSEDENVVITEGNNFVSVGEGKTNIIGTCSIGAKEYTVKVSVTVYRPIIALDEQFVVEVENLSQLQVLSDVKGATKDVLYNGESVGTFDAESKTIHLIKQKLPTNAYLMGEDRQLSIETSLASYIVNVDMYTKIIHTKEDFDNLASLSKKAYASDAALWDGYFVLGADIAYNGLFASKIADLDSLWAAVEGSWSNGGLYGFRGVFDGKGHKIEGITIDNGSQLGAVFGVLHIDGVIKNVSFTKAVVSANSSLVCGAGGGTVENVYVQYDSMGRGNQHYEGDGSVNSYCSTFFGFKEPTATANVTNCAIDVSRTTFNPDTAIKIVGSEYAAIKNVFVIGGTEDLRQKSNATLSFATAIAFIESANAQGRYKNFDNKFWEVDCGVPVSKAVYSDVYQQEVRFTETTKYLVAGTSYKFALTNDYAVITSDNEKVVINGLEATVADTVINGEQVVITVKSIFDATKVDTFTCTLMSVDASNCVDLTAEENAYYDITVDKVYFAGLAEKIDGEVLYVVSPDYKTPAFGRDGDAAQELIAVTKDKLYKFNCRSVTKVIAEAEDLHYLRRNYTVTSYGNRGCYDGVLSGTFVLVNDINCEGLTLEDSGNYWENSRGFQGILEGNGYTISNLSVGKNGLFGALSYAEIRNVNFTGVRLQEADQGSYVALFANRVFNTVMENVSVQFAKYVAGTSVYHTSGLLFYETSFDSIFRNVTIDISQLSGVKYLTECFYNADKPNKSEEKSVYEKITVIVADLNDVPAFAYKAAKGDASDVVPYPDSFTIKDKNGNVKA